MPYIVYSDFKQFIQNDNLQQIISNDVTILTKAQITAESEVKTYLVQKYLTNEEFTDTKAWSNTVVYNAYDRVCLDATAYNAASMYSIGALVLQAGNIYQAKQNSITGTFDATKFDNLGPQYSIYYAIAPYSKFQVKGYYNRNDYVFWRGRPYRSLQETIITSHESAIQYNDINDLPLQNVFPDNPAIGSQYWAAGVAYTVPAGTLLSNTAYWTPGDNRNQQMVMYIIDIALYHVHSRISPRNIPELRMERYDNAIAWLKAAARGDISADLPAIQPLAGNRIRYGGHPKINNTY